MVTKYVYDGWQCIAELDGSNVVTATYAWGKDLSGSRTGAGGVGGLLWVHHAQHGRHFYAYDGNGNVCGLTAATDGTRSGGYEYDPFGGVIRVDAGNPVVSWNEWQFSTKRKDPVAEVVLYEYRGYDVRTGRWLSRDPGEESSGIALYSAISNSPIQTVDIYGFVSWALPATPVIDPSPVPGAMIESVTDNLIGSNRRTPNQNFMGNHRTAPAIKAIRERLRQYMEDGKGQLCRDNLIDLPDRLYTGSGDAETNNQILMFERTLRNKAMIKAEANGRNYIRVAYPLEFYHIPQTPREQISWIGGLDWVLGGLEIDRGCCTLEWSVEVKFLDKLGMDSEKFHGTGLLEKAAGNHIDATGPRYLLRAQFTVKGVVNCCE